MLKQKPGVGGSIMIICRALQKLGVALKKQSRHASERDTGEVRKNRLESCKQIDPIEPRRLVFVDGTGVTTAMTPTYGRAPRVERVEAPAPASWESVTVIVAIGLHGVRAPLAFPGSVNAAIFESYVEQFLVLLLSRGDVVAFDDLLSRLGPAVFEAIERAATAAIQPGLHADRGDVLEVQAVLAPGRSPGQGSTI